MILVLHTYASRDRCRPTHLINEQSHSNQAPISGRQKPNKYTNHRSEGFIHKWIGVYKKFQTNARQSHAPKTERRRIWINELESTTIQADASEVYVPDMAREVFEQMDSIKHQIQIDSSQIYALNTARGVFVQTNVCWPTIPGRPKPDYEPNTAKNTFWAC